MTTPDTDRRRGEPAVFLEREGYRRRRLMDAARLLPIFGAALILVPLLWPPEGVALSRAIAFIFGVWAAMIVLAALLGHASRNWVQPDGTDTPEAE